MQKAERKELDLLSKDIFGSSSRWQKLVDKGYTEAVMEDVEEEVPAEKEGEAPTKQMVKKPVLVNGAQKLVKKWHTVESVLAYMVEQKAQLDVIRAKMAQQREDFFAKLKLEQEAQKVKEEANKLIDTIQSNISGSAK